MSLVPDGARKLILDSSPTSHSVGFGELFAFLDKSSNSALGHRILKYFDDSPALHQHLSESLEFISVASGILDNCVLHLCSGYPPGDKPNLKQRKRRFALGQTQTATDPKPSSGRLEYDNNFGLIDAPDTISNKLRRSLKRRPGC
jgi:hypothetical protein